MVNECETKTTKQIIDFSQNIKKTKTNTNARTGKIAGAPGEGSTQPPPLLSTNGSVHSTHAVALVVDENEHELQLEAHAMMGDVSPVLGKHDG